MICHSAKNVLNVDNSQRTNSCNICMSLFDGSPPDESIVHRAVIDEMQDKHIKKTRETP